LQIQLHLGLRKVYCTF